MKKQKMLVFHPVLATYRIDQFNSLGELFDLEVVFLYDGMWNFKIDQDKLVSECRFKISFLLRGPEYKGRLFRFGMYRKIKQAKPDIIMGYEYSFTTQYLILLKTLGLIKQKIGSSVDDSLDICNNVQSKLRKIVRDRTVKRLDFLVVMSEEVSSFHRVNFGLDERQIIVSPILQLPERIRREPEKLDSISENYLREYGLKGKKVLLFVGRFIPEKALPLFIDTISSVLSENEDCVFVLIGEGAELEQLKEIVNRKKLGGKVFFPGKFQAQELYAWYVSASGFVLPSVSETFGAVVNEALIFGLSVLCSRFAGASCLINENNGLIFNPLDKDDVAQKLNLFLNNINAAGKALLREKAPLIEDYRPNFIKEWGKLIDE